MFYIFNIILFSAYLFMIKTGTLSLLSVHWVSPGGSQFGNAVLIQPKGWLLGQWTAMVFLSLPGWGKRRSNCDAKRVNVVAGHGITQISLRCDQFRCCLEDVLNVQHSLWYKVMVLESFLWIFQITLYRGMSKPSGQNVDCSRRLFRVQNYPQSFIEIEYLLPFSQLPTTAPLTESVASNLHLHCLSV